MRISLIFVFLCMCFAVVGCGRNNNPEVVDTTLSDEETVERELRSIGGSENLEEKEKVSSTVNNSECEGLNCNLLSPNQWSGVPVR